MWIYAAPPFVLGLFWSALSLLDAAIPPGEAWWSKGLLAILSWALGAGIIFMQLLIALAAPILDLLSEQTEEELGTLPKGGSFLQEVLSWRFWKHAILSIREALVLLGFKLLLFAVSAVVSLVPVVGPYAAYPLSGVATGVDFLDYPLARRGWRFERKRALIRQHWPACVVYGLLIFLMFEVPGLAGIMLAPSVIGGTWLVFELEPSLKTSPPR